MKQRPTRDSANDTPQFQDTVRLSADGLSKVLGDMEARVMRAGSDVTVVAIGRMVPEALQAADDAEKEGISVEVVDPRTLLPLDEETIIASVKKTTRCVTAHEAVTRGGFGAELTAVVQQGAFDYLDAPIERVGAKFAPLAFAPAMEQWVVPHAADVLEAVKRTVART